MAKEEKPLSDGKKHFVYNNGERTIKLKNDPVSGQTRHLLPGQSIECLDKEEHDNLTAYPSIIAGDKFSPSAGEGDVSGLKGTIAELKKENQALTAERDDLLEKLSDAEKALEKKKGK